MALKLEVLQVGGWKPFSLVDVVGRITFTVWSCGCNLKCPFCHNWRQAEWQECMGWEPLLFEKELKDAKEFVDMVHLTGGEPTLQPQLVKEIAEISKRHGVPFSLNTNCTTPTASSLIDLADHVATDIKVPFDELSGLPPKVAGEFWNNFLKCVSKLAQKRIPVELRVPVAKGLTVKHLDAIREIVEMFEPEKVTLVINPLVTEPLTNPRDKAWCSKYCHKEGHLSKEEEPIWKEFAESLGVKYKIKKWLDD